MARTGTLLVAVVALVVVSSGATATVAASTDAGEPAAGVSDQANDIDVVQDNETDNDTDEQEQLQPGVYADGSVVLREVYEAHSEELLADGYSAHERAEVVLDDTTFYEVEATTTATPDAEHKQVEANVSMAGQEMDVAVWMNETLVFYRMESDDNVTFRVRPRGGPAVGIDGGDGGPDVLPGDGNGAGPPGEGPGTDRGGGPMMASSSGVSQGHDDDSMMGMHEMGPGHLEQVSGAPLALLDSYTGEFTLEETSEGDVDEIAGDDVSINDSAVGELTLVETSLAFDEFEGDATGDLRAVATNESVVRAASVTVESPGYGADATYRLAVDEVGVEDLEEPGWIEEVPADAYVGPPR